MEQSIIIETTATDDRKTKFSSYLSASPQHLKSEFKFILFVKYEGKSNISFLGC